VFPEGLRDLARARHFGCKYIETSAKLRLNVDQAFSELVREIRRYNKQQRRRSGNDRPDNFGEKAYKPEEGESAGCCAGCVIV